MDARGYDRSCTFTQAPADLLQAARRLRHRLARKGPWEWAWSCELGEDTGMRHVHAVIRGEYWDAKGPENEMYDECKKAGWGWPAPRKHDWGGLYAAKNAVYASKTRLIDYAAWRKLNGGVRPWHLSRGYLEGTPLRDWVRKWAPSTDLGPWESVRANAVPRAVVCSYTVRRVAARRVHAGVEAVVARRADDDAAEARVRDVLEANDDPLSMLERETLTDTARRGNAFAGMPRTPWWK